MYGRIELVSSSVVHESKAFLSITFFFFFLLEGWKRTVKQQQNQFSGDKD